LEKSKKRGKSRRLVDWKRHLRSLQTIMVMVAVVLALYYFSQSSFFSLEKINTTGLDHLSAPVVIKESGLVTGSNIFKVDLTMARRRLMSYPLVDDVKISRHLPNAVTINIKERFPRAIIISGDQLLLVDQHAYCLERLTSLTTYNMPIITGIQPDSTELGKRVSSLPTLNTVLAAFSGNTQNHFSEFNITGPNNVIAYTRSGIPVLFGNTDSLTDKMELAISFLGSISSSQDVEYLDIRALQAPAVKYRNIANKTN